MWILKAAQSNCCTEGQGFSKEFALEQTTCSNSILDGGDALLQMLTFIKGSCECLAQVKF